MQHNIDIKLHDNFLQTLQNAQRVSIDIGGSLAKLAYLVNVPRKKTIYNIDGKEDICETEEMGAQLHFIKFETKCIEACLDFIQKHIATLPEFQSCKVLKATGGGAYKYIDLIQKSLNFKVEREDEMDCLVLGCNFLLKNIPDEAFSYHKCRNPEYEFQNINDSDIYPYLLVNIGSGVSILKVESETKYTRIGGTSMGGGTFWGLGSLLTQAKGFDELLSLAERGDHRNVDMLVKDIYGGDYNAHNLPANLIASSFGKTVRTSAAWYPPANEELENCGPIYYDELDVKSDSTYPSDIDDIHQSANLISFEKITIRDVKTIPLLSPQNSHNIKKTPYIANGSSNSSMQNNSFISELYDAENDVKQPMDQCFKETKLIDFSNNYGNQNIYSENGAKQWLGQGFERKDSERSKGIKNISEYNTRSDLFWKNTKPVSDEANDNYLASQQNTTKEDSGLRKNSCSGKRFREEDIAHSLLIAISNDIGQIAFLNAQLHRLTKIYFGGFFIRGHPVTMHTITYAINFWSKGQIKPLFLRHEGYLGAVGAFLKGLKPNEENSSYSWCENYVGNSDIQNPLVHDFNLKHSPPCLKKMDFLMFERFEGKLCRLKLLANPEEYIPDLEDLTRDTDGRNYWFDLFLKSLDRYADQAKASQPDVPDVESRVKKFRELYCARLIYLSQNIYAYGHLSVRILLDTCLQCLSQCGFNDPYLKEKRLENEDALKLLPSYYSLYILKGSGSDFINNSYSNDVGNLKKNYDRLPLENVIICPDSQLTLIRGILAGNIFDWGSRDILPLLESRDPETGQSTLTFSSALNKIPPRPWLIDDCEAWFQNVSHKSYKCAAIFVDNSGADLILGIFCFTDRLLALGTKVILCANSKPAFNDVTYPELIVLANRVGEHLPVVRSSLQNGFLIIMETGSGSPCIDFMRINDELNRIFEIEGVDLLVLEGMGRCVHTNLNALFKCDTLKIAVLKDDWFAKRLGGRIFSPIFKFTPASRL
ncbi:4'-phosphopantetheine phosphatase-like isoform X2 [Gordionus sp. m RMFG-2023]|uniref:4'-phosphopantetheine phosphatase-like isoform X2 n=1 Tax=Gordionus sp. m RMFG-2023 TaxID=3053472 RepID=UPI0031FC0F40